MALRRSTRRRKAIYDNLNVINIEKLNANVAKTSTGLIKKKGIATKIAKKSGTSKKNASQKKTTPRKPTKIAYEPSEDKSASESPPAPKSNTSKTEGSKWNPANSSEKNPSANKTKTGRIAKPINRIDPKPVSNRTQANITKTRQSVEISSDAASTSSEGGIEGKDDKAKRTPYVPTVISPGLPRIGRIRCIVRSPNYVPRELPRIPCIVEDQNDVPHEHNVTIECYSSSYNPSYNEGVTKPVIEISAKDIESSEDSENPGGSEASEDSEDSEEQ